MVGQNGPAQFSDAVQAVVGRFVQLRHWAHCMALAAPPFRPLGLGSDEEMISRGQLDVKPVKCPRPKNIVIIRFFLLFSQLMERRPTVPAATDSIKDPGGGCAQHSEGCYALRRGSRSL